MAENVQGSNDETEDGGREVDRPSGDREPNNADRPVQIQAAAILALERSEVRALFSGPLPPPSILAEYDKIIPGAAERILSMAESQSRHRRELEQQVIRSDAQRADRGLRAGFVLSLTAIIGGVAVAIAGHPTAGATIATAAVATLAGVFVYGTHSRRSEREEKAKLMGHKSQPVSSAPKTE